MRHMKEYRYLWIECHLLKRMGWQLICPALLGITICSETNGKIREKGSVYQTIVVQLFMHGECTK